VIVILALIALIPGKIAANKGHSFWLWYGFGIAFWIVALPASLIAKDARPRCPYCAEPVKAEASVCPHCHREMQPSLVPQRDWNSQYEGILHDPEIDQPPSASCPTCSTPLSSDDRFCSRCGTAVDRLQRPRNLFEEGYLNESGRLLHDLKVDAATRGDTAALDQIDSLVVQMRQLLDSQELKLFDHYLTVGTSSP
jgi:hypothetical protein